MNVVHYTLCETVKLCVTVNITTNPTDYSNDIYMCLLETITFLSNGTHIG